MAESRVAGVFNCAGPDYGLTMGRLLQQCRTATGSNAELVWVDDKFLVDKKVSPWNELPLWLPEENAQHAGLMGVDLGKALGAGLTFRPVAETILDTVAWDASRIEAPEPYKVYGITIPPAGIPAEREAELLGEWAARRGD